MSIPKEPRQLMINLMYLVLTALLALNVSAEIFNAFNIIDDALRDSNQSFEEANDFAINALEANAQQDPEKYGEFLEVGNDIQRISTDFYRYVQSIKDTLVEVSGGYYPEDYERGELAGKPIGYKNKDITTTLLVNQGKGEDLRGRIEETREQLIARVRTLVGDEPGQLSEDQFGELLSNISLNVDSTWQTVKRPVNWSTFTFRHMPVGSVLPILSKFQNDMQSSEAGILNFLVRNLGVETFKVDAFIPIASAEKSYVIAGEPYRAEVTIGASSKSVFQNMEVEIDGKEYEVDNRGVAEFVTRPTSTGVKSYNVDITLVNPTTGDVETYSKTFSYEVGRRSVTVSADKMNVLYIGVDNPISVSAAGVSSNDLRVSGSGSGIEISGRNGKYVARVKAQGTANIKVSGGGLSATNFEYRVKRIPDPVARLGNLDGGNVGSGVFGAQLGLIAALDNFDFDARCNIVGFELVRIRRGGDPVIRQNPGASFNADNKRLMTQAKPGDRYYFENVRAKCPGDPGTRKINSLGFNIR